MEIKNRQNGTASGGLLFLIFRKGLKSQRSIKNEIKRTRFSGIAEIVLVLPYECEDEINFIVEVFLIRPFVRFVRAKSFINEEQLKIKIRFILTRLF